MVNKYITYVDIQNNTYVYMTELYIRMHVCTVCIVCTFVYTYTHTYVYIYLKAYLY